MIKDRLIGEERCLIHSVGQNGLRKVCLSLKSQPQCVRLYIFTISVDCKMREIMLDISCELSAGFT